MLTTFSVSFLVNCDIQLKLWFHPSLMTVQGSFLDEKRGVGQKIVQVAPLNCLQWRVNHTQKYTILKLRVTVWVGWISGYGSISSSVNFSSFLQNLLKCNTKAISSCFLRCLSSSPSHDYSSGAFRRLMWLIYFMWAGKTMGRCHAFLKISMSPL